MVGGWVGGWSVKYDFRALFGSQSESVSQSRVWQKTFKLMGPEEIHIYFLVGVVLVLVLVVATLGSD